MRALASGWGFRRWCVPASPAALLLLLLLRPLPPRPLHPARAHVHAAPRSHQAPANTQVKAKLEQLDAGVLRWRTADRLLSVFSALYHEQRCDLQRCVLGVLWGLSAGDAVGALERAAGDTLDVQQVSQLLEGAMAAVPTLHRDHTGADSPAARLLWLRFAAALGIARACSLREVACS